MLPCDAPVFASLVIPVLETALHADTTRTTTTTTARPDHGEILAVQDQDS